MNTIILHKEQRKIGSNQTPREYFDFLIDGASLKSLLNYQNADLISPFGWGDKKYQVQLIDEFRLKNKPEITSGRTMVYICPECGDIYCGAITVKIHKEDDKIIWSDFAFENGESVNIEDFKSINKFEFNKHEYFHLFDILI